jgi:hypothetical protein
MTAKKKPNGTDSNRSIASNERPHHDEYAFRLAKLAAMISPKIHIDSGKAKNPNSLQSFNNQKQWEIALDEAESLFDAASRRMPIQYAYRLFSRCDGFLSCSRIAQIFTENGWDKLTTRNSCEQLLSEIIVALRGFERAVIEDASVVPKIPFSRPTEHPAWMPTTELKMKQGRTNKYCAERILYLAHLFLRGRFGPSLERSRP